MIVHHQPGRSLMDREALAAHLHVSEMTIRRHCADLRVGVDRSTGRALYDEAAVQARLATTGSVGRAAARKRAA